jgi:hypothetical protein
LGISLKYVLSRGAPYIVGKALNKAYNFALYFTLFRGFHKKLWPSKVLRILILRISGLATWESQDK